ncbi:MAG: zinc ribbon domain-containing protein, partial [Enterococcus sp.]
SMELSKYMADVLDKDWNTLRGMEIVAVAVASISYTDDSTKLINMRNEGAMLGDANIREGYVQGSVARGMEAAGKNDAGAATGFFGMGMGMNAGGNYLNQASQNNQQQINNQQSNNPQANSQNTDTSSETWTCPQCGTENTGKFCSNCGTPKPAASGKVDLKMKCSECGSIVDLSNGIPKFCPECGKPFKGVPLD